MKSIHDEIEEHKEEIEHPYITLAKRAGLFLVGLFMFYLMFTYMGVGPDNLRIFEGQLASNPVGDNWTIYIDNETNVVFDEDVYDELGQLYATNQRHEFKACLQGDLLVREDLRTYHVTGLFVPEIFDQSVYHVVSAGCGSETLISLHSHPYKHCLFSEQDILTYDSFREKSPDGIIAIMCEEARFSFHGHQTTLK